MSGVRVAVIIVSYNSRTYLARCLHALKDQTFRSFRTIVVDNASADGSVEAIRRDYTWVELIAAPRNMGFAAANNVGAAHAKGSEWLVMLNPDAFPEPNWLESLLRAAEAHPQFSFFGCRMLTADTPDTLDGVGDVYHVSGLHWREKHGRRLTAADLVPREIFAPCAAAAMYRASAYQQTGGFDEDYFCYAEDIDLGFRLRLAGHRALYVPDAVVHHVGSASTGKRSDFSVYYGQRNMVWTFLKNMPNDLALLYFPMHFIMNVALLAVLGFRGQGKVVWQAKMDAIRGFGRMLRKRRAIQASRKVTSRDVLSLMARGWPDRSASRSKAL